MIKKNYRWYLLAGLLFILVLVGLLIFKERNSASQEMAAIKIGYRAHGMYAPLFVGLEKGFFAAENLNVEAIEFQSTNQLMEALVAGRIDAALGGVNTFLLFTIEENDAGHFKIFSLSLENQNQPASFIITAASSTINEVADLQDKKIASYLGSGVVSLYRRFIEVNEISGTELVQMEPKLELSALESGQVDAALVLEPFATTGTYKKISRPLEAALFDKYFMENIPFAASVMSNSFLQNNPEAAAGLVRANDMVIDFIDSNPSETKSIMSKYVKLDQAVLDNIAIAPYQKFSDMNRDKLQELSDLMFSLEEIKSPVPTSPMFLEYDQINQNK